MLVTPPSLPVFDPTQSELEKLATEFGFPPLSEDELEEEPWADSLVEAYAVFARRGWLSSFELETEFDEELYCGIIEEIIGRAGVDGEVSISVDDIRQADDWLDLEFIVAVSSKLVENTGFRLLVDVDSDMALVAIVPEPFAELAEQENLLGEFKATEEDEP